MDQWNWCFLMAKNLVFLPNNILCVKTMDLEHFHDDLTGMTSLE